VNLSFDLRWSVSHDGETKTLDPVVFELLRGVRQGGHLNYAAKAAGVSYRHAWGLMRTWEKHFGAPLLSTRQGRGAQVTEFGEALLAAAAEVDVTVEPALTRAALDAGARLSEQSGASRHPVAIVSSHNEQARGLSRVLAARHRVSFDVAGSEHALNRYRRGDADIAGFHLPIGELGPTVAAQMIALLDPERDRIWLLEIRSLGLMSRSDNQVCDIAALPGGNVRFINRQPGSGTRLIFDGMLGNAGIAPGTITGYADEEFTHTAVAALVASGGADAGFGSAIAAEQFKLHFEPLVDERFYLVMSHDVDPGLRRAVDEYCRMRPWPEAGAMKADEFTPTVAVLKRVHRAGFWKSPAVARDE